MPITVEPITENFAAEIGDLDLSKPVSAEDLADVRAAFATYAVVVIGGQELTDEAQMAFASHFGPLETTVFSVRKGEKLRLHRNMADVSNLDPEGKVWSAESRQRLYQLGNRLWHTDSSFKRLPAYASMLYAKSIAPIGGHTEFADLRAAYDALPEETKRRVVGKTVLHSIMTSRAKLGFSDWSPEELEAFRPVPQVLCRTLPDSGRTSLYLASHAGDIVGMDKAEAVALLEELTRHATQRQFVYTHRWRVGDLVIWDNRCTMHRGTAFDDVRWRRDVRRATVSDVAPTCEQNGIAVAAE